VEPIPRTRIAGAVVSLALSTSMVLAIAVLVHRLKQVFDAVDAPMPGMVLLLMTVSDIIRSWWPVVLGGLVVEALALVWSLRRGSTWLRIRTWILVFLLPLFALILLLPLHSLMSGVGKQK